jgi:hypothetical protein
MRFLPTPARAEPGIAALAVERLLTDRAASLLSIGEDLLSPLRILCPLLSRPLLKFLLLALLIYSPAIISIVARQCLAAVVTWIRLQFLYAVECLRFL